MKWPRQSANMETKHNITTAICRSDGCTCQMGSVTASRPGGADPLIYPYTLTYWILINGLPHDQQAKPFHAKEPWPCLLGYGSILLSGPLPWDDSWNKALQKFHVPLFLSFTLVHSPIACDMPFPRTRYLSASSAPFSEKQQTVSGLSLRLIGATQHNRVRHLHCIPVCSLWMEKANRHGTLWIMM